MNTYQEFLKSKRLIVPVVGKRVEDSEIHPSLFPFQRDVVRWAVRKGRAALFLDTGLGKTRCSLEWARLIGEKTLIVAPLSVARQTVNEGKAIDVEVHYTRSGDDTIDSINITNYEMLEHFNPADFGAVVLDESSIVKNFTGKIRSQLIDMFHETPYRLCCTATPAPNDIQEIANHAEFLGIMTRQEMLSVFFRYAMNDSRDGWRLKNHAVKDFYRWLASWAMAVRKPSDIGYLDDGYILPELNYNPVYVSTEYTPEGMLPGFLIGNISAIESKKVRHGTLESRMETAAQLIVDDTSDDQWIVWCGLNDEGDWAEKNIPDSIQIKGSDSPEKKLESLEAWLDGCYRVLITKATIAGKGMNFQNAHKMIFAGLDYSWEQYYQAVRRCYRFGQQYPVQVYIVLSNQESDIYELILKKEQSAMKMLSSMIEQTRDESQRELKGLDTVTDNYNPKVEQTDNWTLINGDSVEEMAQIKDDSVALTVTSIPFSDLFVYNNTPRDVGNSKNLDEFGEHLGLIIHETLRATMPGRLMCIHIKDLPNFKYQDGFLGRKDFSGQVIEMVQSQGWIYWHRITIDINPQMQAVRTKDSRLMFKTLEKDSIGLAGAFCDYILVFKKPGDNPIPVLSDVSRNEWIEWAHPVWYNISPTDTLETRRAKSNDDEKHICPLQLPVIQRCVRLWSNKGELILDPFAGIASTGYEALRYNRRFVGIELKPEYWKIGCENLRNAERIGSQLPLFALIDEAE